MKQPHVLLFGLLILIFINGLVLQKEHFLSRHQTVFLELAPSDPRSLMQGDYMALTYKIALDAQARIGDLTPKKGLLVLKKDSQNIASFVRFFNGRPLSEHEFLFLYRYREGEIFVGKTSYFFQEGLSEHFSKAVYGEYAIAADGTNMLVALRNDALEKL